MKRVRFIPLHQKTPKKTKPTMTLVVAVTWTEVGEMVGWLPSAPLRRRAAATGTGIRADGCAPPPAATATAEALNTLDIIPLPPPPCILFSHRARHLFGAREAHGVLFETLCEVSSGRGLFELTGASRSRREPKLGAAARGFTVGARNLNDGPHIRQTVELLL